jgi:hypothetical protein
VPSRNADVKMAAEAPAGEGLVGMLVTDRDAELVRDVFAHLEAALAQLAAGQWALDVAQGRCLTELRRCSWRGDGCRRGRVAARQGLARCVRVHAAAETRPRS